MTVGSAGISVLSGIGLAYSLTVTAHVTNRLATILM
jgi:hypothetical protein